ncbi:MAG TPA: TrkA family potassium uptake protein [Spirochaetales bacterium]|mgnify:CR=1 FL=1|nr:TrkA family potassium uptake protein [Spirochaetales bacterium]
MKQYAILGLDYFGKSILEELIDLGADVLIIDSSRELIDQYRDRRISAVVMDVIDRENLSKVLPKDLDGVIIDLGDNIEASILATSNCKKLGIQRIFVKAVSDGHAEILEQVGASMVFFPNREAAKRVTPLLMTEGLLNYQPISGHMVIAEIQVPVRFFGRTLLEANLRKDYGLNLISVRNGSEEYGLFTPEYVFRDGDTALVSGLDESVALFAEAMGKKLNKPKRGSLGQLFRHRP